MFPLTTSCCMSHRSPCYLTQCRLVTSIALSMVMTIAATFAAEWTRSTQRISVVAEQTWPINGICAYSRVEPLLPIPDKLIAFASRIAGAIQDCKWFQLLGICDYYLLGNWSIFNMFSVFGQQIVFEPMYSGENTTTGQFIFLKDWDYGVLSG